MRGSEEETSTEPTVILSLVFRRVRLPEEVIEDVMRVHMVRIGDRLRLSAASLPRCGVSEVGCNKLFPRCIDRAGGVRALAGATGAEFARFVSTGDKITAEVEARRDVCGTRRGPSA